MANQQPFASNSEGHWINCCLGLFFRWKLEFQIIQSCNYFTILLRQRLSFDLQTPHSIREDLQNMKISKMALTTYTKNSKKGLGNKIYKWKYEYLEFLLCNFFALPVKWKILLFLRFVRFTVETTFGYAYVTAWALSISIRSLNSRTML